MLWWESEAVGLLRTNDRLYNKISHLEARLALNIAAYPERFYAEMQADNWHKLMRAAGVKVRKSATPEAMRAHFDEPPISERGETLDNYLCGCDHEGRPMLSTFKVRGAAQLYRAASPAPIRPQLGGIP